MTRYSGRMRYVTRADTGVPRWAAMGSHIPSGPDEREIPKRLVIVRGYRADRIPVHVRGYRFDVVAKCELPGAAEPYADDVVRTQHIDRDSNSAPGELAGRHHDTPIRLDDRGEERVSTDHPRCARAEGIREPRQLTRQHTARSSG